MAGKNSKPQDWHLIAPDEATPLRLEQPNTTVVLSDDDAAWFGKRRAASVAVVSQSRVATEEDSRNSG